MIFKITIYLSAGILLTPIIYAADQPSNDAFSSDQLQKLTSISNDVDRAKAVKALSDSDFLLLQANLSSDSSSDKQTLKTAVDAEKKDRDEQDQLTQKYRDFDPSADSAQLFEALLNSKPGEAYFKDAAGELRFPVYVETMSLADLRAFKDKVQKMGNSAPQGMLDEIKNEETVVVKPLQDLIADYNKNKSDPKWLETNLDKMDDSQISQLNAVVDDSTNTTVKKAINDVFAARYPTSNDAGNNAPTTLDKSIEDDNSSGAGDLSSAGSSGEQDAATLLLATGNLVPSGHGMDNTIQTNNLPDLPQ